MAISDVIDGRNNKHAVDCFRCLNSSPKTRVLATCFLYVVTARSRVGSCKTHGVRDTLNGTATRRRRCSEGVKPASVTDAAAAAAAAKLSCCISAAEMMR